MPFYQSAEQVMRDKSEYARKGIARGRSVAAVSYAGGVLLVAENTSTALHKVGEIYDRIGFAAVGRYNEFEVLRVAGVRYADTRGYSYDRRDVSARGLANTYGQTLGSIFAEQMKPFEVELCVAEVGETAEDDQIYRVTYEGVVVDEPGMLVMGGQADAVASQLRRTYRPGLELGEAVRIVVAALGAAGGENGGSRQLSSAQLEVAILDRARPQRTFRRIVGAALKAMVGEEAAGNGAAGTPAGTTPAATGVSEQDVLRQPERIEDVTEPDQLDGSEPPTEGDGNGESGDSGGTGPADDGGDGSGNGSGNGSEPSA